MNRLSSTFPVRVGEREMPSEAATPNTTDRSVVQAATFTLFQAAKCNCQASSSATYQRNE